jgi:hypothetical protein
LHDRPDTDLLDSRAEVDIGEFDAGQSSVGTHSDGVAVASFVAASGSVAVAIAVLYSRLVHVRQVLRFGTTYASRVAVTVSVAVLVANVLEDVAWAGGGVGDWADGVLNVGEHASEAVEAGAALLYAETLEGREGKGIAGASNVAVAGLVIVAVVVSGGVVVAILVLIALLGLVWRLMWRRKLTPLPLPMPSNLLSLPAPGLVTEPTMLLRPSWGAGAE